MNRAHRHFLELAAASIDFELSRAERDRLARHLASCPSCTSDLAALRADARTLAALPLLAIPSGMRAAPERWSTGQGRRPSLLRVLAIAAAIALLTAGLVTVGSELIRRMQVVMPSVVPTARVPTRESPQVVPPSPPPVRVEAVDPGDLGNVASMAANADRIVAIGGPSCTVTSDGQGRCWADVWTSSDGSAWTLLPTSDSLEVEFVGAPGAQGTGISDVAAGATGFVAIGYAPDATCTDALCPPVATAFTSPDGIDWSAAPGSFGDDAHPNAVTSFGPDWVVVGERYLPGGPRATVWTSADGVTWTAVPDGPEFEIGGYLDTGEVLLAGGIADIAARGDGLVAAGKRCDELGESCEVALWTSSDGRSWGLQSDVTGFGALRAAAAGPGGFLALGSLCARSDCPPEGDRVAGYFSSDGVAWEAVDLAVPAPNQGVAAVTAGDVFAAVIATDSTPHVSVWASHDGRTWSEVPETLEIEGAVVIVDVTAIVLPLGTALIVGSAETDAPGPTTFVLRIPAQP